MLTFLSRPLFTLLEFAHKFFNNWGMAIIAVTFLLKLVFYPLSEASGRSMAKMKLVAPRMKQLQETYKDDRAKLGAAMMELYKKEKINPASGCLPMLIQLPVFLAFYWVLLESVEMRQAPFAGWIQDLSSRDPLFILPAIMAVAMFLQYKLQPTPADPVQAKVFMVLPLVMSVMFAFFPAGLVLYWVTNTILTIAQQWNINRRIAAAQPTRDCGHARAARAGRHACRCSDTAGAWWSLDCADIRTNGAGNGRCAAGRIAASPARNLRPLAGCRGRTARPGPGDLFPCTAFLHRRRRARTAWPWR
jgi:YidC/Oxa1 family membrane protein insertase